MPTITTNAVLPRCTRFGARRSVGVSTGLASCVLLAGMAHAQDTTVADSATPEVASDDGAEVVDQPSASRGISFSVEAIGSHAFDASFDDAGDVGVTRVGGRVGVNVPLNARADLNFGYQLEASAYRFDGMSPLPAMFGPADPISTGFSEDLSVVLALHQDANLTWLVGGTIGLSYELGADAGDAIIGGGIVGFSYKVSDTLRVGGVLAITNDIEGDLNFGGFPTIDWQIQEKWRLHSTQRGLLSLSYQAFDRLAVSLDSGFERRQYRLDDDGPLADGILTDRRVPVGLGLRWTPTPRTAVTARVGAFVWADYEFHDSNDNEVAQEEADPAAYLMLGFSVRF